MPTLSDAYAILVFIGAIGLCYGCLMAVRFARDLKTRADIRDAFGKLAAGPDDGCRPKVNDADFMEKCKSPLSAAILKQTSEWRDRQKNEQPIGPACLPADFEPTEEMLKLNPYLPRKAKMPTLEDVPEVTVDMLCERIRGVLESVVGKEFAEPQMVRMMLVPGDDVLRTVLETGVFSIRIVSAEQSVPKAVDETPYYGGKLAEWQPEAAKEAWEQGMSQRAVDAKTPVCLSDFIKSLDFYLRTATDESLQGAPKQELTLWCVPGDDAMKAALAPGRFTILIEAGDKQDVAAGKQCLTEALDQMMNPGKRAVWQGS